MLIHINLYINAYSSHYIVELNIIYMMGWIPLWLDPIYDKDW